MGVEVVPYGGWQKCLRMRNREIELIATTEVGPRIIRLGFINGPNEFVEYPDQLGLTGGDVYRGYGGHRLWHAPEVRPRTTYPDNNLVEWALEGEGLELKAPVENTTGIQKQIRLWIDPLGNHVHVVHRLTNRGLWPITLAGWALSVMAPGGRAIIPQEPYRPHPANLLPARPVVVWSYTNMSDSRWTWGRHFIQLRQDRGAELPQKFGVLNTLGWAAYNNGDRLFVKRFGFDAKASYPDFNCNAEFFTNAAMLEVESLGPLTLLEPGASLTHEEHWHLFRSVALGQSDQELAATIPSVLASIPVATP